jgi:hypothetical protein
MIGKRKTYDSKNIISEKWSADSLKHIYASTQNIGEIYTNAKACHCRTKVATQPKEGVDAN